MTIRNFITILLLTASYSSISAQTLQNFVFLNAELSVQMALTAVQDCQEKGYNVSAAVMNREGRLTAFARNPMASPMTSEISKEKPTPLHLPKPQPQIWEKSVLWPMQMELSQPKVDSPFSAGGRFLGGIGFRRRFGHHDECAQAGIDSVADDLEFAE